jgi:hypothetical protein
MAWVTVAQVKIHLKLPTVGSPDPQDADLELKRDQSEAIVKRYISRPDDDDWTDEIESWDESTVPGTIQAAVLLQVGMLWRFRGDDVHGDEPKAEHGFLAPRVVALLHSYRDPALA